MRQYATLQTSARLKRKPRYNSFSTTTATPDQLGINITKSVFGWKYPASGTKAPNGGDMGTNTAASDWIDNYGMPFQFVDATGDQVLLPAIVEHGGTPVPYLPDGLTVVYAPSFMGVIIPADFLKPVCAGGKLTIQPGEMSDAQSYFPVMSSRAVGSWTNNLMISGGDTSLPNMGETLIRLIMSVMECLIYSYSSYPWGNGYNDLSDAIMTKRNYGNFLIYPYPSKTVAQSIVTAYAPIIENVYEPILNTLTGGSLSGVEKSVVNPLINSGVAKANASAPQIGSGQSTTVIAGGQQIVDPSSGAVIQGGSDVPTTNPYIILVIIAVVLYFIL